MLTNRRKIALMIFGIVFFASIGGLFAYNWQQRQDILSKFQDCEDDWCLRIYGNVQSELLIGISYLLNDTFERRENVSFHQLNMYNNTREFNISGVVLWDILKKSGIVGTDASSFRFESTDGYETYLLPISILKEHSDEILIVTHIDGEIIPYQADGGDGPLKVAVFMEAIQENPSVQKTFDEYNQNFVHNSKFSVKYLNMIQIF